jgi:8-oxo-dGTP diphosphatase
VITVVGEHAGREVVSFALAHGEDPVAGLRARGWQAQVEAVEGVLGDLTFRYAVVPVEGGSANDPAGPEGPGLSRAERVHIVPHQRVAAYAVVVAQGRLLLTQLAPRDRCCRPVEPARRRRRPGESPVDAVVREVAEETGQVVDDVRLIDVMTQHWVGRSARGLEDYHAVRVLHTARCATPTHPVVHDVGGSTSDARWVALDDLTSVELVASVPVALRAAGLA